MALTSQPSRRVLVLQPTNAEVSTIQSYTPRYEWPVDNELMLPVATTMGMRHTEASFTIHRVDVSVILGGTSQYRLEIISYDTAGLNPITHVDQLVIITGNRERISVAVADAAVDENRSLELFITETSALIPVDGMTVTLIAEDFAEIDPIREGHLILDEDAITMAVRPALQFVGLEVTDDAFNNRTVVSLPFNSSTKTSAYTITQDDNLVKGDASAGTFNLTLPSPASFGNGELLLKKTDTTLNAIGILGTIDGVVNTTLNTVGETLRLASNSSTWTKVSRYTETPWTTPVTWVAGVTATTTAPTLGTATVIENKLSWRRTGQNIQARYFFRKTLSGTATNGTGDYIFPLPSGIAFNTALVPIESTTLGTGSYLRNSDVGRANISVHTLYLGAGWCAPYSSTSFTAGVLYSGGAGNGFAITLGAASNVGELATFDHVVWSFYIDAPVLGWNE